MCAQLINNDVYKFTVPTPFLVGDVHFYLIKGDCLTLVDAGVKTEEAWHSFTKQLQEIGYVPSDIEQVVITHHHPDHVGLLEFFNKDIPVIGHSFNAPWLSQDEKFLHHSGLFFQKFIVQSGADLDFFHYNSYIEKNLQYSCKRQLTTNISEGDRIEGLSEWDVFETPGHAQSHIVLLRKRDGLLIGGDHLLETISSNPLLEPPQIGSDVRPRPLVQYNDSLQKLVHLEISQVLTGHGNDVFEVNSLIHKRLEQQKERANGVLNMLREKPMTAFEVCTRLFPKVYRKEPVLTMSEAVGQLDFLEELGEIKIDTSNRQYLYYVG